MTVRIAALGVVAMNWPDDSSLILLRDHSRDDCDKSVRACASHNLVEMHMHTKLDRTKAGMKISVFLRSQLLYADHQEIALEEKYQKAAKRAGIDSGDLEAYIDSLNKHLGWDIRVGARPEGQ